MISEEKLHEELKKLDDTKYYGYNWCHQYGWLIREYIKLNKEADWLASQLARFDTCPNEMLKEDVDCFLRCERHMYTKPCWRAFATKAVKDASNNA